MRFYFHQRVGDAYLVDPEGCDYPSFDVALAAAMTSARHLWAAAIVDGHDLTGESIEVTSAEGVHLFSVPLSEALPAGLRIEAAPKLRAAAKRRVGFTTSRRVPSSRRRPTG